MSPDQATVHPRERYFEDYQAGEVFEFGDKLITAAEIIAFATQYDPQVFHLDAEAAKKTHFGGLAASGWMTASVVMRMVVDNFISRVASEGSPGIDDLRWLKPVLAGDRLSARLSVLATRRSASKPTRGLIQTKTEALNQHGEVVMSYLGWGMYTARPTSSLTN